MAIRPRSHTKPSAVDWQRMLIRLQGKGLTAPEIAERIDAGDPSTVRRWKNEGRCPRYDDGAALIQLYEATIGEPAPGKRG